MSYVRAMGDVTPLQAVQMGISAAKTAKHVLADPALPELLLTLEEIYAVESATPSKPGVVGTTVKKNIGLKHVVPPLRAYLYARRNPWVVPAVVIGAFAIPFLLGRASR